MAKKIEEKTEKNYVIDGETYDLIYDKLVKCFKNKDSNIIIVANQEGDILFSVESDCGQNFSWLELNECE